MFDGNWLEQAFVSLLNMSLTGSIVILAVLACRLLLQRAPKIFSYVLWAVVLFRLLCPVSFTSAFSLLGALDSPAAELGRVTYISQEMLERETPAEISVLAASGEADLAQPMESMELGQGEPMESVEMEEGETPGSAGGSSERSLEPETESRLSIWTVIWTAGVLAMAAYGILSMWKFSRQLETAEYMNDNIWVSQRIETPFVYGLIRPRIYLPAGLGEEEKRYILLHEQIHIRRGDHVFRVLGFLALCLHWFNPFVWAAFFISGRDMEMSCDEAVLGRIGSSVKKEYSASLLSLAAGRRILGAAPLAFGEGDTGSRIKNVLRYQKPTAVFSKVVLVLIVAAAVLLLANPAGDEEEDISGTVNIEGNVSGVDIMEDDAPKAGTGAGNVSGEDANVENMSGMPVAGNPAGKVAEGPDTLETAISLAGGQSREYIEWYRESPESAYAAEEWISEDGHLDFPFDRDEDTAGRSRAENQTRYYIPVKALEQASTEELLRMTKEMLPPQHYHLYNMPSYFLGMMQSRFNIIDALVNRADFAQVLLAAYTADAYIPLIAVEQMGADGGTREGEIVLEEIMLSGDAVFDQLNEDERQQALTAVLEKEAARASGAYFCANETSSFFAHVYEQYEEGGSKWYDYIVEERKGGDAIRYLEDYIWSGWFMYPADYLQAGEATAVAKEMYERYRLLDRLVFGDDLRPDRLYIENGVTVECSTEESVEYPGYYRVEHDTIQTMEQLRAAIEEVCTTECAQEEFYRIIDSEPYPYREIDGLLYISIWNSPGILTGDMTIRGIMQRASDSLQPEFVLNDTDSGEPIHCFMDLKRIDGRWYVDGISFEY